MTTTLTQFGARMQESRALIFEAQRVSVSKSAVLVKKSVQAQLRSAAPHGTIKGRGKRPGRIGVRFDLRLAGSQPAAQVYATGPFQLIERDTKAHREPAQQATGSRKRFRKRKVLNIPGIGYRAHAQHPGTKGKHPFQKGVDVAAPLVPRTFQTELDRQLRKAIG